LHTSNTTDFFPSELNDENNLSIQQQTQIQAASQNYRVFKYNNQQTACNDENAGLANLKSTEGSASSGGILKPSKLFNSKKGQQSVLFDEQQFSKHKHQCFQGLDEEDMLTVPYQQQRKISRAPFKVLDAPALQDDYYLNLVDWSS